MGCVDSKVQALELERQEKYNTTGRKYQADDDPSEQQGPSTAWASPAREVLICEDIADEDYHKVQRGTKPSRQLGEVHADDRGEEGNLCKSLSPRPPGLTESPSTYRGKQRIILPAKFE